MDLVKDGMLTIPLYHGTSTLFVASIRRNGLGGVDPVKDMQTCAFLEKIYLLCEKYFHADEEWILRRVYIGPMVNQEVTNGGFNFKHGETYLTPSRESAVTYARSNYYGSEIISLALLLYNKLKANNITEIDELHGSPILDILSKNPSPVLIKLNNVPVDILKGETGNKAEEQIEILRKFSNLIGKGMTPNINFKLETPLPVGQLLITDISSEPSEEMINTQN